MLKIMEISYEAPKLLIKLLEQLFNTTDQPVLHIGSQGAQLGITGNSNQLGRLRHPDLGGFPFPSRRISRVLRIALPLERPQEPLSLPSVSLSIPQYNEIRRASPFHSYFQFRLPPRFIFNHSDYRNIPPPFPIPCPRAMREPPRPLMAWLLPVPSQLNWFSLIRSSI